MMAMSTCHKLLLSIIWALVPLFILMAQPGVVESPDLSTHLLRDLSGYRWKMKGMPAGRGISMGLHKLPPEDIETLVWHPAHVPGDVYTDLWKAGAIEDPYFGRNSTKAKWVMHQEWWYATQFVINEDLTGKVVRIDFDGVDFQCEVWLNGHYLGKHTGAFSPFSFDVTEILRSSKQRLAGTNLLMIKLDPPPQVNALVAGRKTPWFGDYWRDLVPFGIWRPIRLVATGPVRIQDVYAKTALLDHGAAIAELEISVENTLDNGQEIDMDLMIQGKNFKSDQYVLAEKLMVSPGTQVYRFQVQIGDPKYWWPWDLGDQNLYSAKIDLKKSGVSQDREEVVFGIREVQMDWNPGFTKEEVSFPRTVIINGKKHFIRSACWGGPPDVFFGRTSVEEYKELIRLAKEANLNNIRIFGWHPPEIKEFYQLCNEAGLTVWQDIVPLGTANFPKDPKFLDSIFTEAVAVIKERRNHPCLIIMEGGEEAFLRASDAKETNDFLTALGDTLQNYHEIPYYPDSPLTSEKALEAGYKPKEAVHALAYFYNMGHALMEEWYSQLDYPIVPELAITSVPSVESLQKFIPAEELWPPGLSWGHHWADLDKLRMQNFDAFGSEKTGSLEEFVHATQHTQGIIFQLTVEHFRRNKPRTSGVSLCHWITYWPDMKWGIIDNYQQPKLSYDYVKRAYQPLLVNLQFSKRRWKPDEEFSGSIWIVNDLYEEFHDCRIRWQIHDQDGNTISEDAFEIDPIQSYSSKKLRDVKVPVPHLDRNDFYLSLQLEDSTGKVISENQYLFLIGDQAAASEKFKQMGEDMRRKIRAYTSGNYYRYFPTMIKSEGLDLHTDRQIPTAEGFPDKNDEKEK